MKIGVAENGHPDETAEPYGHEDWFFADHGVLLHQVTSRVSRELNVWNAPKNYAFDARYVDDPLRGEVCDTLHVRRFGGTRPMSALSTMPITGLHVGSWLDERLSEHYEKGEVEIVGQEEVAGTPCIKLTVPGWGHGRILWLSPSHEYLVKQRWWHIDSTDDRELIYAKFIVHEFEKLDDGHWFPMRGEYKSGYLHLEWQVTNVSKNQGSDDPRLLVPKPDIGTHVTDDFSRRVYRVAHDDQREETLAAIVKAAERYRIKGATTNTSSGRSNLTRLFPSRLRWPLLLVAAVILLIAVRSCTWHRLRPRKTFETGTDNG